MRVSALLRFEKTFSARLLPLSLRLQINRASFFGSTASIWAILPRFDASTPSKKLRTPRPLPRNKSTSSTGFQFFCDGAPSPLCTPNSTQGHPIRPNAESIGRGSQHLSRKSLVLGRCRRLFVDDCLLVCASF